MKTFQTQTSHRETFSPRGEINTRTDAQNLTKLTGLKGKRHED